MNRKKANKLQKLMAIDNRIIILITGLVRDKCHYRRFKDI